MHMLKHNTWVTCELFLESDSKLTDFVLDFIKISRANALKDCREKNCGEECMILHTRKNTDRWTHVEHYTFLKGTCHERTFLIFLKKRHIDMTYWTFKTAQLASESLKETSIRCQGECASVLQDVQKQTWVWITFKRKLIYKKIGWKFQPDISVVFGAFLWRQFL